MPSAPRRCGPRCVRAMRKQRLRRSGTWSDTAPACGARQCVGAPPSAVAAGGFVAAAFLHRTSRAPDPHLHSHVLVANLAPGPDERWSALDARGLFLELRTARDLYETQLRSELTTRLGVSWRELQGSWADLAGIDPAVRRAFSRRSAEIEADLRQSGRSGPRAARLAADADPAGEGSRDPVRRARVRLARAFLPSRRLRCPDRLGGRATAGRPAHAGRSVGRPGARGARRHRQGGDLPQRRSGPGRAARPCRWAHRSPKSRRLSKLFWPTAGSFRSRRRPGPRAGACRPRPDGRFPEVWGSLCTRRRRCSTFTSGLSGPFATTLARSHFWPIVPASASPPSTRSACSPPGGTARLARLHPGVRRRLRSSPSPASRRRPSPAGPGRAPAPAVS